MDQIKFALIAFTMLVLASAVVVACEANEPTQETFIPVEVDGTVPGEVSDSVATINTESGEPGVLNFMTDSCAMWPQKLQWAFSDHRIVVIAENTGSATSMDVTLARTIQDDSLSRVVSFVTALGNYYILVDKEKRQIIGVDNDMDHALFLPVINPEQ
jgi:hypothetical protein